MKAREMNIARDFNCHHAIVARLRAGGDGT